MINKPTELIKNHFISTNYLEELLISRIEEGMSAFDFYLESKNEDDKCELMRIITDEKFYMFFCNFDVFHQEIIKHWKTKDKILFSQHIVEQNMNPIIVSSGRSISKFPFLRVTDDRRSIIYYDCSNCMSMEYSLVLFFENEFRTVFKNFDDKSCESIDILDLSHINLRGRILSLVFNDDKYFYYNFYENNLLKTKQSNYKFKDSEGISTSRRRIFNRSPKKEILDIREMNKPGVTSTPNKPKNHENKKTKARSCVKSPPRKQNLKSPRKYNHVGKGNNITIYSEDSENPENDIF